MISDIIPLADLSELSVLHLNKNEIAEISVVTGFTKLKNLFPHNNLTVTP